MGREVDKSTKMKNRPARTPRQELIDFAAAEMRRRSIPAHNALECVSSDAREWGNRKLGAAIRAYYIATNDNAVERLIKAVERRSR